MTTVAEQVLAALRLAPNGMSDGELARRLGKRPQHINTTCRILVQQGRATRADGPAGIVNVTRPTRTTGGAAPQPTKPQAEHEAPRPDSTTPPSVMEESWPAESVVQALMVESLTTAGWSIERSANTRAGERGVDVIAVMGERRLLMEVKGYPGTTYSRGPKAGQPKPTQPTLQASHYFDGGLRKCLQMRETEPEARVVLALPSVPRYRAIAWSVAASLAATRVEVWFVAEDGSWST